jgi:hypothetical protein
LAQLGLQSESIEQLVPTSTLLEIVEQLIPKQYGLKSHLLQSESEEQKPRHRSRGNGKITAIIDFTQNFSEFC